MRKVKSLLATTLFLIGGLGLNGATCHYCWGGTTLGGNSYCTYDGQTNSDCRQFVAPSRWLWCYYGLNEPGLCVGLGNPE